MNDYNCTAHPETTISFRRLQARHIEIICAQCPVTVIPDPFPEFGAAFYDHALLGARGTRACDEKSPDRG